MLMTGLGPYRVASRPQAEEDDRSTWDSILRGFLGLGGAVAAPFTGGLSMAAPMAYEVSRGPMGMAGGEQGGGGLSAALQGMIPTARMGANAAATQAAAPAPAPLAPSAGGGGQGGMPVGQAPGGGTMIGNVYMPPRADMGSFGDDVPLPQRQSAYAEMLRRQIGRNLALRRLYPQPPARIRMGY